MKRLTAALITLVVLAGVLVGDIKSVNAGVAKEQAALWTMYHKALQQGDPESFRRIVRKVGDVMREHPSSVSLADMLFLLGLSYENTYSFDKALVYYKELRDVHPYHKNAKAVRYKISLIEKTHKKERDELVMFIQQERFMLAKQYNKALAKCEEMLATYPSSSLSDNVQNVIGYIYMNYLKDYVNAKKSYEKLLRLYPKSPFHDNAIFAVGRCEEELGLYQSALRRFEGLKEKHQGFLLSKRDYWSRVWHTRAKEQIAKLKFKMDTSASENYVADMFVDSKDDFCLEDKRGAGGFDKLSVKSWVQPGKVAELTKEKLQLPAGVGFGDNTTDVALRVWNYVATNYPYMRTVGGDDYWQYPDETVERRSGDEADISFLLSSMLIAGGIAEEKVWVMAGKDKAGVMHFWVSLHHADEWYIMEPSWKPPFKELPLAKHEAYSPYLAFNSGSVKVDPRVEQVFPKCEQILLQTPKGGVVLEGQNTATDS